MPIFLAYETAVEAICYLRTREHDDTAWRKPSRKTSIYDAISTKRELRTLLAELDEYFLTHKGPMQDDIEEFDDLDDLFYLDELTDLREDEMDREDPQEVESRASILTRLTYPLHVLIPSAAKKNRTGTLVTHVWADEIPARSFIEIEPNVYLSTPAFTFLQMAGALMHTELIQLAMQFCGFYSPSPRFGRLDPALADKPLTELHHMMTSTGVVFEIDPVSSVQALHKFVERERGRRGAAQALAALEIARDHAASHMETALYLLLCLPVRLGGYGLPKPELNPKVVVVEASGSKTCYPDLYWRGASVDVEYNSDSEHCGPSAHYKDSKRMVAIVCNRITYLSITTKQLFRAGDLDNAARGVSRMLNHRIRYTDEKWRQKRTLLRAAVLPPTEEGLAS